jgi:hypothetical protein
MFPFSGIRQTEDGLSGTPTVFPIIFIVYMFIYPIAFYVLRKTLRWNKKDDSEFAFADEREKTIVSEAAKTAYKVSITGLLSVIGIIGLVKFYALFSNEDIDIYFISILLLTVLLVTTTIFYYLKWCLQYRK